MRTVFNQTRTRKHHMMIFVQPAILLCCILCCIVIGARVGIFTLSAMVNS